MEQQQSCQDGRVGLRRQFQVLVRKGMGSNPILDSIVFSLEKSITVKLSTSGPPILHLTTRRVLLLL